MTFEKKIIPLRKQINFLDDEIISLLSERFNVVEKVGILKKEFNIPSLQEKRWKEVVEKIREKSLEKNINPDMIEKIWNIIHQEALKIEDERKNPE